MSKYVRGEKIKDMNELVALCINDTKSIFFMNVVRNYAWVRNQQFWWLHRFLDGMYKAELKPKNNTQKQEVGKRRRNNGNYIHRR